MRKKLFIVQPYLTKYRIPVFKELTENYNIKLAASTDPSFGTADSMNLEELDFINLTEKKFFGGRFFFQLGLISSFLRFQPDACFLSANPRYLSFWLILIICKFSSCKVILHGQGLYRKIEKNILSKFQFFLFSLFSDGYIAYTESCRNSLTGLSIYKKTYVAENSIVNSYPVKKTTSDDVNGILFIGRLREGADIGLLIDSVADLRANGYELKLHIIGGGDERILSKYKSCDFIVFHGEVYDTEVISNISKDCFIGCYPGDAGLSILHYMSLSLPPVVHSSLHLHMGPEPSYIVDNVNGKLFKKDSVSSLKENIEFYVNNKEELKKQQTKSFETYEKISSPSLGKRFYKVIEEVFSK